MGNAQTVEAPKGLLPLTLGPEPVYVKGVPAGLWGSRAEHLLSLDAASIRTTGNRPVTVAGPRATARRPSR